MSDICRKAPAASRSRPETLTSAQPGPRAPLVFAMFLLLCGGSCLGVSPGTRNSPRLVGGNEVNAGDQLNFVVRINGNCSAVRIGLTQFLTAAHCVTDKITGKISAAYGFRRPLLIENPNTVLQGKALSVKVFQTAVHPAAVAGIDLASIHSEEIIPLDDVPIANLSSQGVSNNATVHMTGYGCEAPGTQPAGTKLKVNEWRLFSQSADHYKTKKTSGGKTGYICPGDSGGPLLMLASGAYLVIGINVYVEEVDNAAFDHLTRSAFVRTDEGSGHKAYGWIIGEGKKGPGGATKKKITCSGRQEKTLFKGLPQDYSIEAGIDEVRAMEVDGRLEFLGRPRLSLSLSGLFPSPLAIEFIDLQAGATGYVDFDYPSHLLKSRLVSGPGLGFKLDLLVYGKAAGQQMDIHEVVFSGCQ